MGTGERRARVLDSLLAAERLTRSVLIDAYPAGASDLVVQLCDLIAQAGSVCSPSAGPATGSGTGPTAGSGAPAARGVER